MAEGWSGPSPDELRLLDPDGRFRERLVADRAALRVEGRPAKELAVIAHRLAGAAGTFGYPEIGDAAMALEDAVEAAAAEPALAAALGGLLAALDTALGR